MTRIGTGLLAAMAALATIPLGAGAALADGPFMGNGPAIAHAAMWFGPLAMIGVIVLVVLAVVMLARHLRP